MFLTEKEMSVKFEKYLKGYCGNSFIKERAGLFGVPDFIFYIKDNREVSVVSFELKLKDWKRAAQQAFRYKSFSNIAYVVLASDHAKPALRNIDFFKKYEIGLASFNKSCKFEIHYKPELAKPYSDSLSERFLDSISTNRRKVMNNKAFL